MNRFQLPVIFLAASLFGSSGASADSIASDKGKLTVRVDQDGHYQISAHEPGWNLMGRLPSAIETLATEKGKDVVGDYQQLTFAFSDRAHPMRGYIRLYDQTEVIQFSQTCAEDSIEPPSAFPSFTSFPSNLYPFSYQDSQFSPPKFALVKSAGPWLCFDSQFHVLVLSPASHFPCASMEGDGKTQLASGFNAKLRNVPAGFSQQSILVLTTGINHALDLWGHALTAWEGKVRLPNDADPVLKYLGYWTDRGGYYWYNYDLEKGYEKTLLSLMNSYRTKQIPFGYLQLDSWWYHKTLTRFDGKVGTAVNDKLPEGDWNRYGGTVEYKAHPFVFPDGMETFHQQVGLPLVTHNRWIDPTSPYHERYKISGIAAVDPAFWNEIGRYLHSNGVTCYEQDWMVAIFENSPELSSTVDQGETFLDSMAEGCKKNGLSMQYCMATPRCFLQGSKYDHLTSIRVNDDHFTPHEYHNFFYTSKLADALGIWPFADVFQSTQTSSAILSTLSAGPVGSGDAENQENKENLTRIVRADGVIVKPDAPLVAMDRTYLAEAEKQDVPMLASTYTDHGGIRTVYLTAFKRTKTAADQCSLTSDELSCRGPYYLFNYLSGKSQRLEPAAKCSIDLEGQEFGYYVVAPINGSGVALLGDADRFVGTGKKRISTLRDDGKTLSAEVILSDKEQTIRLRGYAAHRPKVSMVQGVADAFAYDATTGMFTVAIHPSPEASMQTADGESIRRLTIVFSE